MHARDSTVDSRRMQLLRQTIKLFNRVTYRVGSKGIVISDKNAALVFIHLNFSCFSRIIEMITRSLFCINT